MTNQQQQHPLTPPPKLLQQWANEAIAPDGIPTEAKWQRKFATLAAQWGADQELEACCEWFIRDWTDVETADKLRAARRPKPLSLAEEALEAWERQMDSHEETDADMDTIRLALERLQELEGVTSR